MSGLTRLGIAALAGMPDSGAIFALDLALQCARRGIRLDLLDGAPRIAPDALQRRLLAVPADAGNQPFPVLRGFADRLAVPGACADPRFTVGLACFERVDIPAEHLDWAARLPLVIAGSTWMARLLRAKGLDKVQACLPGVDPALFHPAPRADLFPGRFAIFSGGRLGYRKGHDILVAAFRIFHQRHPDALLVGAWGQPGAAGRAELAVSGHVEAPASAGVVHMDAWLARNGIAPSAQLDLGRVERTRLPGILRECALAVFPSRCEGGVSLLAMEAMACGLPTVLAANTGHLDLAGDHAYMLAQQGELAGAGQEGWGESDVEELLEAMERAYRRRRELAEKGRAAARFMADWHWERRAGFLLDAVAGAAAGRPVPPDVEDDYRWALCLHRGGRLEQARRVYDAVLARAPGHPGALGDRGNARRDLGDAAGAEADFRAVLAARPGHVKALHSLGRLLRRERRLGEAAAFLRQALQAADTPARRWDLAITLLAMGRYGEAWPHFEHRHAALGLRTADPAKPRWDGREVRDGALLVLDEQGIGDTLQFLRFLPHIPVGPGGRVIFAGKPAILATVRRILPAADVYAWDGPLPRSQSWVPLMSLPACLGVKRPEGVPPPAPLPGPLAQPERIARWRSLVRGDDRLPVVGLCWRGNPDFPDDAVRSPGLAPLLPLLALPGLRFVALQQGHGRQEIAHLGCSARLADVGGALEEAGGEVLDTLAALEHCDLVISSCTSLAHMAGVAGRPGWLMLASQPDWRWMLERDDTPWYPSLSLVRQQAPGDWDGVVAALAASLEAWRHSSRFCNTSAGEA